MNWYIEVMKKYASPDGRARRKEYWMFCLINTLICMGLGFVEGAVQGLSDPGRGNATPVLTTIYQVAVLIPSLSVGIRRMHDTDRSGWWIVVPIANLLFALDSGTPGENRFGSDPKAELT